MKNFILAILAAFAFVCALLWAIDREALRQSCLVYDKEQARTFYNYERAECEALVR